MNLKSDKVSNQSKLQEEKKKSLSKDESASINKRVSNQYTQNQSTTKGNIKSDGKVRTTSSTKRISTTFNGNLGNTKPSKKNEGLSSQNKKSLNSDSKAMKKLVGLKLPQTSKAKASQKGCNQRENYQFNDSDNLETQAEGFLKHLAARKFDSSKQIAAEIRSKYGQNELELLLNCSQKMALDSIIVEVIEYLLLGENGVDDNDIGDNQVCFNEFEYENYDECDRVSSYPTDSNISVATAEKERLKFLEVLENAEEDPIFVQHEAKIEDHETTIRTLRSKKRKSKNDIARMEEARMKIEELEWQKKQFEATVKQIKSQLAFQKALTGENKTPKAVSEAKLMFSIEKQRLKLSFPIYARKSEIIKLVEENQFLILIGETGSGKSTQLVQYMLECPLVRNSGKLIACVQPRKLAVQTVSKRVAEELKTNLGDLVGFQTGLKNVSSTNTKIKFMMDRLFLDELLADRTLSKYSCVIIDEAHERNINTDILLSFIKNAAKLNRQIRFIITSATLNEELFQKYFSCKSLKISGRTYPVECLYYPPKINQSPLDAIDNLITEIISARGNEGKKEMWNDDFSRGKESINNISRDDAEDVAALVSQERGFSTQGHVLVFVSGVDEIETLIQRFERHAAYKNKYMFLPLHGRLTSYEQRRVFATDAHSAGTNITKIIFSTRIAETAVTINDVSVVIDIGYDRDYVYDQSKRLTMNMQQQITQAQANQRAGRAGRTRPGVCYRIYSQEDFEQMEQYKIPELKRISLDQAVLKLKQFNIDDVLGFDFIERPDDQALKQAIDSLKLLGALDDNEKITHLGEQMGMLPTDPAISRVVIEAIIRECEQEVCKIIALMSFSGNLFFRGRSWEAWETSDRRKYDFCHPSGDLMTFLKIFENWEFYRGKNQMRRGWCFINTLNVKSLQQAEELFEELKVIAQTIKSRNSKFRSFFGATTTITDKKKQSENSQTAYLNDVQNLIDDLKQEEVAEKAQQNEDSELDEMSQLFFEVHREISKEISNKITDSKIQEQSTENDSIQFALEEDFFQPKSSNLLMKNSTESNDQAEKIQYPEYLELDKKYTDILQSFLCAYFPNIALHSGSEKLGYTFLRENRLIRLHGASSLSLQGVRPKWIMCGEIQVMQDYNCTKIASYIDINWIKNLIPPKFLQKYNIIELDVHPIYKDAVFPKLSSHVIQSFKLGKGELLQKMKEKFNVSIEENTERNEICVWASQHDIKEVTKMTEEIIEEYIKLSKRETIERSVVQSGLVRVIIGAGAEVKDILLGDEFRKLTFAKMPFKNETGATKFFDGFGPLEWVEVRKTPHSLLSQGEVVFRDAAQAKQAYDAFKDKYEVRPSTAKGRIVTPNIKVVFKWFTGRSNNRGMVLFETRALVTQILDELSDQKELFKALLHELEDDKKTKLSRGHNFEQSIMVYNLSEFVDDIILKKAFKKIFPDHRILTATVFREKTKEDFYEEHDLKIGKKTDPRADEKEVSEYVNLVLDHLGNSEDIMKLEFLPTIANNNDDKKAKFRRRAELVIKNEEVAKKLVQYLNNKVEIRSYSRLHVEIKRSRTWRLDTSTFQVVKDQLEMQIEDLIAKLGDKIEISILGAEGNKKYYRKTKGSHNNPALRISSDNKLIMEHVMCEFQKTLLGDSYYLNTTAEYKKLKRGENFTKNIESECKVKLKLFNREKQLKIFGNSVNIARAKEKITEFLSLKNETEKIIDFKRLNMSKLLRNETTLLNTIEKSFPKVIFDLRLSGKKLILVGPKDAVDKAEVEIMKHVTEFNQSDNQNQEVDKKCTLCYNDIAQGYKLEFCGHKLCLKCLEAHIKQSIHDIHRFPINCPSCDKQPVPISQTDLRNIAPENVLAKLWQNSYKNFIAKNDHKYRACPGFGCENIYLIKDSDKPWVDCAICSMRYCRKCQKFAENLAESDDDNDEDQSREPDDCKYCADDLLSISSFHSDDDMYSYD